MLRIRKAEERGHADHGWLNSHHTFSFADYYDPAHMGFGSLRVINDDTVAAGGGFPPHGHRDMEIISYVIEGALQHQDNMGNGSVIRPGDVQRMSAGTGVVHAEYNASKTEPVHFLQIWILPQWAGLPSGYEQKFFSDDDKRGKLRLIASRDGAEGSVRIQQDAQIFATVLEGGASVHHSIRPGRKGWLHVVSGEAKLNDLVLKAGDGVAIDPSAGPRGEPSANEQALTLTGPHRCELLLFDMAVPGRDVSA